MIDKAFANQGMFSERYWDIWKGYCLFCHGLRWGRQIFSSHIIRQQGGPCEDIRGKKTA
jgi:hypothetical protein